MKSFCNQHGTINPSKYPFAPEAGTRVPSSIPESIHGIIPFLVFDVGYMAVADDHPVRMALDVAFDEVIGLMEKTEF